MVLADRDALARVYAIALEVVPEAEQGTRYAMAALVYRDKGLVAAVRRKRFLSLYPYSGGVIASALEALSEFETTSGSTHFAADHELPDDLMRRIVQTRRTEIDATAERPKTLVVALSYGRPTRALAWGRETTGSADHTTLWVIGTR